MTRLQPPVHRRSYPRNASAILVSFSAVSFLYFNFNPTPAGADPEELASSADVSRLLQTAGDVSAELATTSSEESSGSGRVRGRTATLLSVLLLEKGRERLKSVADYTSRVFTQERVDGVLLDPQVMTMKLRHSPRSVYLKWLVGDKGRELLWVDGANNGDLLVKVGGIKGKLLPPLKLDPTGDIALREARHPVTKIGLLNLAGELIANRQRLLNLDSDIEVQCEMLPEQEFDGRPCYCFLQQFPNPDISPEYRKSLLFIDKNWNVPVLLKNFGWPHEALEVADENLDEETLVEFYNYTNVRFEQQLADADFDRSNSSYSFRR